MARKRQNAENKADGKTTAPRGKETTTTTSVSKQQQSLTQLLDELLLALAEVSERLNIIGGDYPQQLVQLAVGGAVCLVQLLDGGHVDQVRGVQHIRVLQDLADT
eukprot:TRINITY_DN3644_c0_g2_i8.p4 TRINITY_DN3644_c0_g2~~TRINITY_DN3644_c0_g2_i8.p4  ORF type:complete len:105 (+),score=13.77 TRINITY_DN3644_c0_g2_i8:779-1093(+)